MEQVIVRPYEESRDADGFLELRSIIYNDGWPIKERENYQPDFEHYVAELDGKIVGLFTILPQTCNRLDAVFKCGAVASVGVAPDVRRGGVGAAMMSWYVNHAAETGVEMANLYGFREPWYRKFGYEVAGKRYRVTFPSGRLPNIDGGLPVRRLRFEDYPIFAPCYEAFARQRSGMNMRQAAWQWKRVMAENKPLVIYAFGDPVEAYVAVSHQTAFWVEQSISEIVWTTARGYHSALGFLRQLAMNKTSIAWFEPSDGPVYSRFLDNGVQTSIERGTMFRVNDVPAALRAVKAEGTGEFTVRISDHVRPENAGPWRVRWADGVTEVTRTDTADFDLDILRFAQVFLGEPSLEELWRFGDMSVPSEPAVKESALRFFRPIPTTCYDFF